MKQHKEVRISNRAAHFTTGVSVTLALFILGFIALIKIAASAESKRMLEKIEISVVLADSISDATAAGILDTVARQPFALDTRLISRQQAMQNWKDATGEDLEKTFGVNPLSPEIAFTLKSDFSSARDIDAIKKKIAAIAGVEEVGAPDGHMIEAMNDTIRKLTLTLTIIAAIMLVISFVLINNTVRLSIYSRRFTIHTMQLVGATDGFIRRPFVAANCNVGLLSGLLASSLLAAALAAAPELGFAEINSVVTWSDMILVSAGLLTAGAIICSLAALLATTRHLRQDYEDLFR